MITPISIITCVVGVIGCVIGVATFVSAQITKAKQDGMVLAKVEQCVQNTEEIRKDIKEKNKEIDNVTAEHARAIVKLQTEMKEVQQRLNMSSKG